MSGPLSLREARTKRQKANVYKTSRSEFRSTLVSTPDDLSSDSLDDKDTRRKIKKVDEHVEGESKGEGSEVVNVGDDGKNQNLLDKAGQAYDDLMTSDDSEDAEEEDDEKNKSQKEEEPDVAEVDEGGNVKGQGDGDKDQDDSKDKEKKNDDSDPNGKEEAEEEKDDDNDEGSTGNNDEEKKSSDVLDDKNDGGEEKDVKDNIGHPVYLDPYDEEYSIEDVDSDEEDPYEFLSQDGGSGGHSEHSFGGGDDDDDPEEMEVPKPNNDQNEKDDKN